MEDEVRVRCSGEESRLEQCAAGSELWVTEAGLTAPGGVAGRLAGIYAIHV